MKLKLHILILVSILTTSLVNAQEVGISLSQNQIQIGEQVELTLTAKSTTSSEITLPVFNDTLGNTIEVIEKNSVDTSYSDDLSQKTLVQKLIITSFDSGYHVIEPISVKINNVDIPSKPEVLEVSTIQIEENKIADIKGVYQVKITIWDYLKLYKRQIIIGLIVFLILAGLIIWLVKRPKKEKIIAVKKEPVVPAHIIAKNKLKELQTKKLWQDGKYKEYHSELSDIVREYIELRYKTNALELTTEEILLNLRTSLPNNEVTLKLKQILVLSDLAKFAKEKPIASENELSLENAFAFIEETKLVVQPTLNTTEGV